MNLLQICWYKCVCRLISNKNPKNRNVTESSKFVQQRAMKSIIITVILISLCLGHLRFSPKYWAVLASTFQYFGCCLDVFGMISAEFLKWSFTLKYELPVFRQQGSVKEIDDSLIAKTHKHLQKVNSVDTLYIYDIRIHIRLLESGLKLNKYQFIL